MGITREVMEKHLIENPGLAKGGFPREAALELSPEDEQKLLSTELWKRHLGRVVHHAQRPQAGALFAICKGLYNL